MTDQDDDGPVDGPDVLWQNGDGPDVVWRRGAFVWVTFQGKTSTAMVTLASTNAWSLILMFDALLGGYAGTMPVLWNPKRRLYEDLIIHAPVVITPYPVMSHLMQFRVVPHSIRPGVEIVELWYGEQLVGQITPGDSGASFRVLTKYRLRTENVPNERAVHIVEIKIGE